jgi:glycerol-3-phosphate dehydrogenase (NAD(P)+)
MAKVPERRFAVIGAGSFGTSLALVLARNGLPTVLWGRNATDMARLHRERVNQRFLPDSYFPDSLAVTACLSEALDESSHVLVAVPSHAFTETLNNLFKQGLAEKRLVWATKGFEPGTARLLHEVVAEVLGPGYLGAVLSGPTFAVEVAAGLPTAVTVGCRDESFAAEIAQCFHNQHFRVYTSTDVVGVQVGGGVKNVLALAAGIADGLGFGANSRAALITRGLAELIRLGVALGARPETFMGLAGIGDLVLTCTDNKSRNRRAGLLLGEGLSVAEAQAQIGQVVEGVSSAREVVRLATRLRVEMPIAEQVEKVLHAGLSPSDAVRILLGRSAGPES